MLVPNTYYKSVEHRHYELHPKDHELHPNVFIMIIQKRSQRDSSFTSTFLQNYISQTSDGLRHKWPLIYR